MKHEKTYASILIMFFGIQAYAQTYTDSFDSVFRNVSRAEDGDREERNAARVHPNPTDGTLTVEADGIAEVTIYGTDGTKLAGKRIDGTATLDLSGLATGIYFYEIRTENGIVYGKLMKR